MLWDYRKTVGEIQHGSTLNTTVTLLDYSLNLIQKKTFLNTG